ncbi:hypothetical protein Tco_1307980 [Tanacetum coccineum]
MENANLSSPPESPTSPREPGFELVKEEEDSEEVKEETEEEFEEEEEEDDLEYFNTFPTKEELKYHKVRGLSVFVGNFTYACDFVNLEDVSSVIDAHLGQMVLGKPFVEESKLVYDQEEGMVLFEKNGEKVTYKMPHKMDRWKDEDYMEFDNIPSFWVASKEDKEKGDDYIYQKRETYYSDYLKLGPTYKRDEGVIRAFQFIHGSC